MSASQAALWTGSLIALNNAWYSQYPRGPFQLYNDSKEWQQIDKVGHAYSAYWMAQFSSSLFRWSGITRKKAAIYGAGMGIAYLSVIEILDGFSTEWGFSLADMAANTGGSLLYASQEYLWQEQRIQFKFSSHLRQYSDPELALRTQQKFGKFIPERILKDYNAQSYWLSINLKSFAPNSKLPAWLNVAIGYGADNMYGGYENQWLDKNTGIYHDRRDIVRYRQLFFSPDIDLSKIKIHGKTPTVCKVLNGLKLKFPLPTLEINSLGKLRTHLIYF